MNQDALLKLIAESGYNIGYAAKKHLATFDIVEKIPGWIALISLAAGVYALFMPEIDKKPISAAFILIGVAATSINFYLAQKDEYARVGGSLTGKFHELRALYQQVKSQPATANMDPFLATHQQIQTDALSMGIPKQIFLSDWYAHYKFYWQMQTGWMDEQLHFKLVRDKIPLGVTVLVLILVGWICITELPALVMCRCTYFGQ
jgi:hypothetical protein